MTKTVAVFTNMPEPRARITLTIKGEVWMPVQVTPRSAAFGKITIEKASQGLERKLTIVNNVEGRLTPTDIKSTNPMFAADIKPIEEGKKYELAVRLVEPIRQGNNTGEITMRTGLEDKPELRVQTYAYVTSAVDVSPPKLELPADRARDLTRLFHIRSNTNKPVKLSNLKSSNPDLTLELTSIKNTLNHRLKVVIPASYNPPPEGDRITLNTDNPLVPEITIPITKSRFQRTAGRTAALRGLGQKPAAAAPAGARRAGTRVSAIPPKEVKKSGKVAAEPSKPAKPAGGAARAVGNRASDPGVSKRPIARKKPTPAGN